MADEIREALDEAEDGMEQTSSDDSDIDDDDDEDDADDDDGIIEGEVVIDGDDPDIQADLTAALRNGQLEAVDDATGQMINDQLDFLGGPPGAGWGGDGLPDEDGDMEGDQGHDVEPDYETEDEEDDDDGHHHDHDGPHSESRWKCSGTSSASWHSSLMSALYITHLQVI